jgi:hypothetical protein
MFLAYLDSSGRPDYDDKENYVLTSIITQESQWQYIDNKVKEIKLKHFPNLPDTDVEIHAKDMLNRDGLFNGMKWEEIYAIFGDVFNFIADDGTQISILAVLIEKSRLRKKIDIELWAYRLLFERINRFLERQNVKLIQAQLAHQFGILITDSTGLKQDQTLRTKLYGMLKGGTLYSKLNYLIEDPLFTDSKWRNLSQLVDCVAYCIRKQFRKTNVEYNPDMQWDHNKHWQTYYKRMEIKFDNPHGSYYGYGLKIFP